MRMMKFASLMVFALGTVVGLALASRSQAAPPQASAPPATVKQLGTIKSMSGKEIVLAPDNGAPIHVVVQSSTRVVRISPGEKDLKNAVPITQSDLQEGDRILVRGNSGESGQLVATGIIAMKLADLESKQQAEREDWQKRGVAGLVSGVEGASGTVSVSVSSLAGKKTVAIHTNKDTVVRRYAPGSVRFDEAQPGTLSQIKAGDQLRARGSRSADGSELTAEEIVSGSFRNIAGTVGSVDASSGTITVLDAATKKAIAVKVTTDSQLRSLPPEMAKRMAVRMAGGGAAGVPSGGGPPNGNLHAEGPAGAGPGGGGPGRAGPEGGPPRRGDLQQMFNRLPALTVGDVQKGDTVMLVATEESDSGKVTAIKLLDGVEPLLAAAPKSGGESMTLSPWSLGGQGGSEDAN